MRIKDIIILSPEYLKKILGDKRVKTLLVKHIANNSWVLFNTQNIVGYGYNQDKVIKGINEGGYIENINISYATFGTMRAASTYLYIPYKECSEEDKKFLDDKRSEIERVITITPSHRKLMSEYKEQK